MLLECCPFANRPHGLSGRSMPRLGRLMSSIPFFFMVPALAPGLVVSQILRAVAVFQDGAGRGAKGDPSWV